MADREDLFTEAAHGAVARELALGGRPTPTRVDEGWRAVNAGRRTGVAVVAVARGLRVRPRCRRAALVVAVVRRRSPEPVSRMRVAAAVEEGRAASPVAPRQQVALVARVAEVAAEPPCGMAPVAPSPTVRRVRHRSAVAAVEARIVITRPRPLARARVDPAVRES